MKDVYSISFNTSHVVIYLKSLWSGIVKSFRFNTSHVVIYLMKMKLPLFHQNSFNTSHVVIYRHVFNVTVITIYVSIHLMLLFIMKMTEMLKMTENKFQYISCCYLSEEFYKPLFWVSTFQYISCCYLSKKHIKLFLSFKSFNTSHVVIYPDGETLVIIGSSFNTSHVVIYLW